MKRTKYNLFKSIDGRRIINGVTYPHTPGYQGTTQTIESDQPKGQKLILVPEPITKAFYPPLREVVIDKISVAATPLEQKFYLYADGYWLDYYDRVGISKLLWFKGLDANIPPVPTQPMKDLAFTMALSRVADSPFMGAVDLGEVRETIDFMKHPFRELGDIFQAMTKKVTKKEELLGLSYRYGALGPGKRIRRGVSVSVDKQPARLEAIANTWLEYRYAVTPLVYSITGLAETAATQICDLLQNVHSARGANTHHEATAYDANADWLDDGYMNFRRGSKVTLRSTNTAAYVIRYVYYPWMVDAINLARYGISPTQVMSTAFELTKLSFVSGWFVNIGQWLKAMEPKPQVKILDICYTHKYKREVEAIDNGGLYSYYSRIPAVPGAKAYHTREYMKRQIVTNTVQAPIPRMRGELLSLSQTLDSIALLSRPIGKFFGRYSKFL